MKRFPLLTSLFLAAACPVASLTTAQAQAPGATAGAESGAALERAAAPAGTALELKDGDTVVLLGDAFIERDYNYGFLEAALTASWADKAVRFRNLGWSGDTPRCEARSYFGKPEEGFARLKENLQMIKPTVVVCSYGAVDAFQADSGGLADFSASYGRLLDMVRETTGARIILTGPPPSELGQAHEAKLAATTEAIRALAQARGLHFGALAWAGAATGAPRTVNGVTLTEKGYADIARSFVGALGTPADRAGAADKASAKLRGEVVAKNRLFFHRWRPQNETYLFGFRKHEQGNNGAEIPQFDPLIAEKEKAIAALLKQGPL